MLQCKEGDFLTLFKSSNLNWQDTALWSETGTWQKLWPNQNWNQIPGDPFHQENGSKTPEHPDGCNWYGRQVGVGTCTIWLAFFSVFLCLDILWFTCPDIHYTVRGKKWHLSPGIFGLHRRSWQRGRQTSQSCWKLLHFDQNSEKWIWQRRIWLIRN